MLKLPTASAAAKQPCLMAWVISSTSAVPLFIVSRAVVAVFSANRRDWWTFMIPYLDLMEGPGGSTECVFWSPKNSRCLELISARITRPNVPDASLVHLLGPRRGYYSRTALRTLIEWPSVSAIEAKELLYAFHGTVLPDCPDTLSL